MDGVRPPTQTAKRFSLPPLLRGFSFHPSSNGGFATAAWLWFFWRCYHDGGHLVVSTNTAHAASAQRALARERAPRGGRSAHPRPRLPPSAAGHVSAHTQLQLVSAEDAGLASAATCRRPFLTAGAAAAALAACPLPTVQRAPTSV